MVPLDSETGNAWSEASVKMLTEKLKSEADAELRKRDEERSEGRLSAANGYKVYAPDSNGRFAVDPLLRSLRHTGRERRLLLNRKMAEFCMEPKSEAEFIKKHVAGDRRIQGLRRWLDGSEDAKAARPEPVLPGVVSEPSSDEETPRLKRRPGRPRKVLLAANI